MNLLLDTHCWLWSNASPENLNDGAQRVMVDRGHALYLSSASAWEVALKYAKGKLPLPEQAEKYVLSRMAAQGLIGLPIQHVHATRAAELPRHHSDPFDRMLIAQAQVEGWPLMTADPEICAYDVEILWASREVPPKRVRLIRI